MRNEAAEQKVLTWFQRGLNHGDWDVAREVLADGFVYHGSDGDLDLDAFKARIEDYRRRYPELLFTVNGVVSHADRAGVEWTAVTKNASSKGVGVAHFSAGKCQEFWGVMPNL